MECSICNTRSSVGFCGTCQVLLCEVCGSACQGCGKGMCPQHRAQTPSGRTLCPTCMAARNAQRMARGQDAGAPIARHTPPAAPPPSARPPVAATSFADLLAGDDDLAAVLRPEEQPAAPVAAAPPRARTPIPAQSARMKYTDDSPEMDELERRAADLLAKSLEEEKYNDRVLTGSARRGTPVWVSGLFIGGLACILLLLVTGAPEGIKVPMRYVVILVGLGGVALSGQGFYRKKDPPKDRYLCLIGVVLSIFAVFVCLIS